MDSMEFAEWETLRRSTVNFRMQIRTNLHKDDKKVFRFQTMKLRRFNQRFKFRFLVTVFPNGVNAETEGWIVVLQDVRIPKHEPRPRDYGILSCTVSVIDIEGNSRIPRSFVQIPSESDDKFPKYLERSVIFDRKDEFLRDGILTVRCDIHFYLTTVFSEGFIHRILKEFLGSIPQEFFFKDESQTGDSSERKPRDSLTVFDFTRQILTLPEFHPTRKRFGVYGVSPLMQKFTSESEDSIRDMSEHVWIIDTGTVRFLVSLDERQDSVGARLLNASPAIRRIVNAPMKEQITKRIHFSDITSRTFIIVLFFLEKGTLPTSPNRDILGVYKFAHFYEMGALQRKCAEEMVKSLEFSTEELKRIAVTYPDKYLSELLVTRSIEYENTGIRVYERLNSDSYI